jgi:hypothetical protein
MMMEMSGVGNMSGERTMRTSAGQLSSGISQSRMTTSGGVQHGDAIAGFDDALDADIVE